MKRMSLSIVLVVTVSNGIPCAAMQEGTGYQLYKNPAVRQKVSEGWQTTRERASRGWQRTQEFVKTHKRDLAAIAAIIGIYITQRGYERIFDAYGRQGIYLAQIRQENKKEYIELVMIGMKAYANRLRDRGSKSIFVNETIRNKHRWIYDKYTPNLEAALWHIMESK